MPSPAVIFESIFPVTCLALTAALDRKKKKKTASRASAQQSITGHRRRHPVKRLDLKAQGKTISHHSRSVPGPQQQPNRKYMGSSGSSVFSLLDRFRAYPFLLQQRTRQSVKIQHLIMFPTFWDANQVSTVSAHPVPSAVSPSPPFCGAVDRASAITQKWGSRWERKMCTHRCSRRRPNTIAYSCTVS